RLITTLPRTFVKSPRSGSLKLWTVSALHKRFARRRLLFFSSCAERRKIAGSLVPAYARDKRRSADSLQAVRASHAFTFNNLSAGSEHDGVGHCNDPTLWLGKAQTIERPHHTTDHIRVRHAGPTIAHVGHRTVTVDDEADRNTTLQTRVCAQALLVTQPETTVVLPNDA